MRETWQDAMRWEKRRRGHWLNRYKYSPVQHLAATYRYGIVKSRGVLILMTKASAFMTNNLAVCEIEGSKNYSRWLLLLIHNKMHVLVAPGGKSTYNLENVLIRSRCKLVKLQEEPE